MTESKLGRVCFTLVAGYCFVMSSIHGCGSQSCPPAPPPPTPATPETSLAPVSSRNGVEVTLTNLPHLEEYRFAMVPDKCVEFDYIPRQVPQVTQVTCRMLWCGSIHGGLATLWCR